MSSVQSRLNLPKRRSKHRFALTPLADAMFQLLIFFMLTSNLSPYSFLTLKSPAGAAVSQPGEGNADPSTSTADLGQTALWTVEEERILVGGQPFGFDKLAALAAALGSDTAPAKVILVVHADARVQDVASVLEALNDANIQSLQVIPRGE